MKKLLFLWLCALLSVAAVCAQKRRTISKPAPGKTPATRPVAQPAVKPPASPVTEISDKDWTAMTDALDKEDWTQAAALAAAALNQLTTENDKQQLARLRYFYVYAAAGKAAAGKTTYAELEKILENFIGREFVMPPRVILTDCRERVNYICAVKNDDQVLRVTAADKVATIHSFEYVKLSDKFDAQAQDGKNASLAAILESVEAYTGKSKMKIPRLTFAAGLVTILPNQTVRAGNTLH